MSIYQLQIKLNHIQPLITRTILMEDACTFFDLAQVIMTAFNWGGGHLWQFQYKKPALMKSFPTKHSTIS